LKETMTRPCLPPHAAFSRPAFAIPAGACDSHAHVFGPFARFPLADERSYTPAEHVGANFIAHLDRLGLTRGVLVTASASGTDNGSVIQALAEYPDRLRGIAVPSPDVTEAELDKWTEAGVRGVRVNLFRIDGHAVYRNGVGIDVLEALAPRIAARGWHAQIWLHAPDLPELAPRLRKLGLPMVIDHMGRMAASRGAADPGFRLLCNMLADGVVWTKISGADRLSSTGAPFLDVDPLAQAVLRANIERVVWGTDWPHINYFSPQSVPDDGDLLNLLARWLPDEQQRNQVLVTNPAKLYDFPA
jgi:predicted TIM-barrel fold metal-dependent hydrolase